jgi:hypothetical protein
MDMAILQSAGGEKLARTAPKFVIRMKRAVQRERQSRPSGAGHVRDGTATLSTPIAVRDMPPICQHAR